METNFKQEDGHLKLNIEARSNIEREMLKEFMQQEIPGYTHSLQYRYENDKLKVFFTPIINKANLLKEGFVLSIDMVDYSKATFLNNQDEFNDGWFTAHYYVKKYNKAFVVINTFGTVIYYDKNKKLAAKNVRNIYELRQLLGKNEKIWLRLEL